MTNNCVKFVCNSICGKVRSVKQSDIVNFPTGNWHRDVSWIYFHESTSYFD